jgi:hypothetical protein
MGRADHGGRHGVGRGDRGCEHPHGSAHLLRLRLHDGIGIVDLDQDGAQPLKVGLARLGERKPPGGALQEAHAEMLLQVADQARHHGRRQVQLARGGGETAFLHHLLEHPHGLEPIHLHLDSYGGRLST